MLIMPSFNKSLIVEQFQGNYLKNTKLIHATDIHIVDSLWYTKYPSDLSQPYLINVSPKAIFIANNAAQINKVINEFQFRRASEVRASSCRPM